MAGIALCSFALAAGAAPAIDPAQLTKTVELTRLTNSASSLIVQSRTPVEPGEMIVALLKQPDGTVTKGGTTFSIMRNGDQATASHAFSWSFPRSFGTAEIQAAADQITSLVKESSLLQKLKDKALGTAPATNAPAALSKLVQLPLLRPVTLFSVTNQAGGVLAGMLEFQKALPDDTNSMPEAVVRMENRFSTSMLMAGFTATVPAGYRLEASFSDNAPQLSMVHLTKSVSVYLNGYHASWYLPPNSPFTREQAAEAAKEMKNLATQGPLRAKLNEPAVVFAITNQTGEVLKGLIELKGPPGTKIPGKQ